MNDRSLSEGRPDAAAAPEKEADEKRISVSPGVQSKQRHKRCLKKLQDEGKSKQNWAQTEMWLQTTDAGSVYFIYCSVPLEPLIRPLVKSQQTLW